MLVWSRIARLLDLTLRVVKKKLFLPLCVQTHFLSSLSFLIHHISHHIIYPQIHIQVSRVIVRDKLHLSTTPDLTNSSLGRSVNIDITQGRGALPTLKGSSIFGYRNGTTTHSRSDGCISPHDTTRLDSTRLDLVLINFLQSPFFFSASYAVRDSPFFPPVLMIAYARIVGPARRNIT